TTQTLDATGKIVCPGLIDMHVHLGEQGGAEYETIATGPIRFETAKEALMSWKQPWQTAAVLLSLYLLCHRGHASAGEKAEREYYPDLATVEQVVDSFKQGNAAAILRFETEFWEFRAIREDPKVRLPARSPATCRFHDAKGRC